MELILTTEPTITFVDGTWGKTVSQAVLPSIRLRGQRITIRADAYRQHLGQWDWAQCRLRVILK